VGTTATAFYDVTAQVIKNLRVLNPFYDYPIDDTDFPKSKICCCHGSKPNRFVEMFKRLLKDPSTEKEVWIVMGGGLNVTELKNLLKNPDTTHVQDYLIQAQFLLYSTWASVSSAGAKLKVLGPAN